MSPPDGYPGAERAGTPVNLPSGPRDECRTSKREGTPVNPRPAAALSCLLLCAALAGCGEPKLECSSGAVIDTLASMVRDRVRRVVDDAYPSTFDAAKRAKLTKATFITPRAMRLVEWDAISGRLTCVATLVVIVPGSAPDTRQRSEVEVRYRVTRDSADTFLVEIGYDDMMSLFPVRAVPAR